MHARNRAVRRATFLGGIFAAQIVARVASQRNSRISALLRAVVHQPVLADVEIARARSASPIVWQSPGDVVLKRVHPREAAFFQSLHLVVDAPLFVAQRL